jgi:hypothetical protein
MFALLHFTRCTLENVSSKHPSKVTTSKKNIVDRMLHSPISQRQMAAPKRELQLHSQPDGEWGAEIQPLHTRRKRITPVSVRRDRVKSPSVCVGEWKYCAQTQFASHHSRLENCGGMAELLFSQMVQCK